MIKNIFKAVVAVAVSPIDAVADVLTCPESAYNDKPFFHRTGKRLQQAADAMNSALKSESGDE